MSRRARGGQFGHNLTHHRSELEAVARARRGKDDLRGVGDTVDEKVLVGSIGEEAGCA